MPRGKPLNDAPGWRVIERQRKSWPAGYVIVPAALLLGLLQILIPSSCDHPQTQAAPAAAAGTAAAPQAEAVPESPTAKLGAVLRPQAHGGGSAPKEAAAPPGASAIEVSICHTAGAGNALRAVQLAAFLQTRGFVVTDIRPVKDEIARPSVRYFAARDLPATERLVEILGAFFAKVRGEGPVHPVDLEEVSPKPVRGRVEVWLPSTGAGDSRSA